MHAQEQHSIREVLPLNGLAQNCRSLQVRQRLALCQEDASFGAALLRSGTRTALAQAVCLLRSVSEYWSQGWRAVGASYSQVRHLHLGDCWACDGERVGGAERVGQIIPASFAICIINWNFCIASSDDLMLVTAQVERAAQNINT